MSKNRIFLDCGRFDGVAIQQYCVDDSWQIYSFDPYPQPDLDLPPHELIQKAVWVEEGTVQFSIDPRVQASHITGIAGTDFKDKITVPCINFSKFVSDLVASENPDIVICSMDIEGAEFAVLRKMIEERTINHIDVLDIEFHHRMMNDETDESARKLIQELSALGVIVRLKIVLNK